MSTPSRGDLDEPALGAPLARVVEQVRHGPVDPVGLAADDRRLQLDLEAQLAAPARALDGVGDDLIDAHVLAARLAARATSQLDDVADERRELVELLDDVPTQALLLLGRQTLGVAEDLDVRAQRGDRRAQLVARIGHQMALRLDRALERVEGRVEAAGQARELVAPGHRQALGDVETAGERLGPGREAGDRRERRARDQRAEQGRDRDADEADHEQDQGIRLSS